MTGSEMFTLGAVLTLRDLMSGGVASIKSHWQELRNEIGQLDPVVQKAEASMKNLKIGATMTAVGATVAAALKSPVSAFEELEVEQNKLRTNLMDTNGVVDASYSKLSALADKLGTDLPGETKDMVTMFRVLREQSVSTQQILGGVGEAAAKSAVLMELPFAQGAEYVAKFQQRLGIADKDMVKFMDTIQRTRNVGVTIGEMDYAFGAVSGTLKGLGLQGLSATEELVPLFALLLKMSPGGEKAGTALKSVLNQVLDAHKVAKTNQVLSHFGTDKNDMIHLNFVADGKFVGITKMIKEFEKLKNLTAPQRTAVFRELFGGGGEDASIATTMATEGMAGYKKMATAIKNQADMDTKIKEIMSGTKMRYETMSGTWANLKAHLGGFIVEGSRLKTVYEIANKVLGAMDSFLADHQTIATVVGGIAAGGAAFLIVAGGIMTAVSAYRLYRAIQVLSGAASVGNTIANAAKVSSISAVDRALGMSTATTKTSVFWDNYSALAKKLSTRATYTNAIASIREAIANRIASTQTKISAAWDFMASTGKALLTKATYTNAIATAREGIIKLGAATKTGVLTAAQWLLNAAMYASPIGLVVAGIALIVGAVALAIKYYDTWTGWIRSGVEWAKKHKIAAVGIAAAFLLITGPIGLLIVGVALLATYWDDVKKAVGGAIDAVKDFFGIKGEPMSAVDNARAETTAAKKEEQTNDAKGAIDGLLDGLKNTGLGNMGDNGQPDLQKMMKDIEQNQNQNNIKDFSNIDELKYKAPESVNRFEGISQNTQSYRQDKSSVLYLNIKSIIENLTLENNEAGHKTVMDQIYKGFKNLLVQHEEATG